MNTKHTKNDYINEILRLCQTLTQAKYDSDDDRIIKVLIDQNLRAIGKIEHEKTMLKEMAGKRRKRGYGGDYGSS